MPTIKYTTTLDEVIEYERPNAETAAFIKRVERAALDPRVTHAELVGLVYGTENPILEQGRFEGHGAVTPATLANPVYAVLTDLLQAKRIGSGATTALKLKKAFTMTVSEAKAILGMTAGGVRKAIESKYLTALKDGNQFLIDPRSVEQYALDRKPRGVNRGPALTMEFGNAPGCSFRVKVKDLELGEESTGAGMKVRAASVDSFEQAAFSISGKTMNRAFFIEAADDPAAPRERYEHEGFWIEGRFKFVKTVNGAQKASETFKAFKPS